MLNQLSSRLMLNIIKIFQRFIGALHKKTGKLYSEDWKIYGNCSKGKCFPFIYLFIYLAFFCCCCYVESETLFVTAPYIYNVIFNNCWLEISSHILKFFKDSR